MFGLITLLALISSAFTTEQITTGYDFIEEIKKMLLATCTQIYNFLTNPIGFVINLTADCASEVKNSIIEAAKSAKNIFQDPLASLKNHIDINFNEIKTNLYNLTGSLKQALQNPEITKAFSHPIKYIKQVLYDTKQNLSNIYNGTISLVKSIFTSGVDTRLLESFDKIISKTLHIEETNLSKFFDSLKTFFLHLLEFSIIIAILPATLSIIIKLPSYISSFAIEISESAKIYTQNAIEQSSAFQTQKKQQNQGKPEPLAIFTKYATYGATIILAIALANRAVSYIKDFGNFVLDLLVSSCKIIQGKELNNNEGQALKDYLEFEPIFKFWIDEDSLNIAAKS